MPIEQPEIRFPVILPNDLSSVAERTVRTAPGNKWEIDLQIFTTDRWCTISPNSGYGNTSVSIYANSLNETNSARTLDYSLKLIHDGTTRIVDRYNFTVEQRADIIDTGDTEGLRFYVHFTVRNVSMAQYGVGVEYAYSDTQLPDNYSSLDWHTCEILPDEGQNFLTPISSLYGGVENSSSTVYVTARLLDIGQEPKGFILIRYRKGDTDPGTDVNDEYVDRITAVSPYNHSQCTPIDLSKVEHWLLYSGDPSVRYTEVYIDLYGTQ